MFAMNEFQPLAKWLPSALPAGDRPVGDDAQRQLAHAWRQHAGDAADHCQPLLFASGRLVVFTESASWGNEIRHRTPSIKSALTAAGITITDLTIKILPAPPPSTRRPKPHRKLSPKTAAEITQLATTIPNPTLKRALKNLAKHGARLDE